MQNKTQPVLLRKELARAWRFFFLCGLPVWFLTEWASDGFAMSKFGWGRFVAYALFFPSLGAFSIWRKRRQGR